MFLRKYKRLWWWLCRYWNSPILWLPACLYLAEWLLYNHQLLQLLPSATNTHPDFLQENGKIQHHISSDDLFIRFVKEDRDQSPSWSWTFKLWISWALTGSLTLSITTYSTSTGSMKKVERCVQFIQYSTHFVTTWALQGGLLMGPGLVVNLFGKIQTA